VRIGLACDHVGFEHKECLRARVTRRAHTVEDLPAERVGEWHATTDQLASAIPRGRLERGVVICYAGV
jgi:ribose 5-phosphate isomerase B